jgi:hypothetical protein
MLYQIAPGSDSDLIWILLLWAIIDHYTTICHCAVLGYQLGFFVSHDEDAIGPFFARLAVSLGKVAELFPKGSLPDLPGCSVFGQNIVVCNRFTSFWMDDCHAHVRGINIQVIDERIDA